MKLTEHLQSRHCDPSRYDVTLDEDDEVVKFWFWSPVGSRHGFQAYRPNQDKKKRNDEKYGRYYTYSSPGYLPIFGRETLSYRNDVCFLVEGVFDSVRLHNLNLPCLAVLSNDPKHLGAFLTVLGSTRHLVTVNDDDVNGAGNKLKKFGDTNLILSGKKDLGASTQKEVYELVKAFL